MKAPGFIAMALMGVTTLLAGCASTSGTRSEPTTRASPAPDRKPGMGKMGEMCPMKVPGTTVTSADVEGGVALAFTTSSGDAAELLQRVRRMSEMHNHHHAAGGTMMGGHNADAAGAEHEQGAGAAPANKGDDRGGMMMPAATASVEDIEGGSRLVLRPKDPAQLEALREHARMRAGRMARGECPMMSPAAKEQATAPPGTGRRGPRAASSVATSKVSGR